MSAEDARKREDRSAYTAIVFYAFTVALGIGGAVLAAYGHTLNGSYMGTGAMGTGILSFLAARASIRWRRLAEESEVGA